MWGLLSSYWFVAAAIAVLAFAIGRSQPTLVIWIILAALCGLGVATAFASGAQIIATDTEVIVRRRLRPEWRTPAVDLRSIEEHIPLRPRARSLAGWVFLSHQHGKATIEVALFAPAERRKLRRAFADVLVSPDLGRPPGVR